MSYSSQVKEELYRHVGSERHCIIAELAAIIHSSGSLSCREKDTFLQIEAENALVVRKCFTLLQKTINISTIQNPHREAHGAWVLTVANTAATQQVLRICGFLSVDGTLRDFRAPVSEDLLEKNCCKRAFLRGIFLCTGSMNDPTKSNHLELVCADELGARQNQKLLESFSVEAHIAVRKKNYIVYLKDGSAISDFLNVAEAHMSLMEYENYRIVKDMRNSINRRVNCETANIGKTVTAATRQTEDILFLREHYGFENLPDNLREMAEIRLEYPDANLRELGDYLDPPVGKSGVNHRLRKLSELADRIRS